MRLSTSVCRKFLSNIICFNLIEMLSLFIIYLPVPGLLRFERSSRIFSISPGSSM